MEVGAVDFGLRRVRFAFGVCDGDYVGWFFGGTLPLPIPNREGSLIFVERDELGGAALEWVGYFGGSRARRHRGGRYKEGRSEDVRNEACAWCVSRHGMRLLSDEMRKENPAISGFRQILAAD